MDFDNPKVHIDTSISDGLVKMGLKQKYQHQNLSLNRLIGEMFKI